MHELRTLYLSGGPIERQVAEPILDAIRNQLLADGHLQRIHIVAPGNSFSKDFLKSSKFKNLCRFMHKLLQSECFDRVIFDSAIVQGENVFPTTVRLSLKIELQNEEA